MLGRTRTKGLSVRKLYKLKAFFRDKKTRAKNQQGTKHKLTRKGPLNMALMDVQGTDVVRRKLASFKSKIQAAEKRAEKAKQGLRVVEERYNRTMGIKTKMEQLISTRDSQLDRTQARITRVQHKWNALIRFCEEINRLTLGEDHGVLASQAMNPKLATKVNRQTEYAEKRYQASVDRNRVLLDQTEQARARYIRSEASARVLQEQLAAIKERVHILEQRKNERAAKKRESEALQNKVNHALARAHELENMEAELEGRIIELEDKIEMFVQKKKRTCSILADRDNHNSIDSLTIALLLRRSNLITSQPSMPISISGTKDT